MGWGGGDLSNWLMTVMEEKWELFIWHSPINENNGRTERRAQLQKTFRGARVLTPYVSPHSVMAFNTFTEDQHWDWRVGVMVTAMGHPQYSQFHSACWFGSFFSSSILKLVHTSHSNSKNSQYRHEWLIWAKGSGLKLKYYIVFKWFWKLASSTLPLHPRTRRRQRINRPAGAPQSH